MHTVPESLFELQKWFASIITNPLAPNGAISPQTPRQAPISQEAPLHIVPSATLKPHERIEVYNQQYWYRLLSILHESFPLLTSLCGYENFNRSLGIPFLVKHPSNHWSLNELGKRLPLWIKREFKGKDRALLLASSEVDWAYQASFLAKQHKEIKDKFATFKSEAELLQAKVRLQPFLFFVSMDYALLPFRDEIIQHDPSHWIAENYPELKQDKHYFYIVYRNPNLSISWKESSQDEITFLKFIKKGCTIEESCEKMEEHFPENADAILEQIPFWIQEWLLRGWLGY